MHATPRQKNRLEAPQLLADGAHARNAERQLRMSKTSRVGMQDNEKRPQPLKRQLPGTIGLTVHTVMLDNP